MVSEPLDELRARLLCNGACAAGDEARMVENHGPRHRWAEAAFAAAFQMTLVTVVSGCTCGKCAQQQLAVRMVRAPSSPGPSSPGVVEPGGQPCAAGPAHPAPGVSPERALAELEERLDRRDASLAFAAQDPSAPRVGPTAAALVLAACALGACLLAKLLIQLALGGGR